jgi:uncharacterized membrane protein
VAEKASSGEASGATARNIEAILSIEKEDEEKLVLHHRALHAVGRFVGTPIFFAVQCLGVVAWIWINMRAGSSWQFDEYPFPLTVRRPRAGGCLAHLVRAHPTKYL